VTYNHTVADVPVAPKLRSLRMPTVLVVDDDPMFREVVSAILAGAGHRVLVAGCVQEAIATLQLEKPDVILTDQMMPDLDGLSLVHRLRADREWSAVRVIIVSAKATPDDMERARRAGADDYLVKPFSAAELRAKVSLPAAA
jgi:CheY-like chemotaxis protein